MYLKFNRLFLIAIFLITPFIMSCYAPVNDPFQMDRYLMDYSTFVKKSDLVIKQVTEAEVAAITPHDQYKIFAVPMNYESKGGYIVIYDARFYPNVETVSDLADVKKSYFNMSYLFPDNYTDDWSDDGKASVCVGVDQIVLTDETAKKGTKINKENVNEWYLYYNNSWWLWNAYNKKDINWNNLYPTPLAIDGIAVQ